MESAAVVKSPAVLAAVGRRRVVVVAPSLERARVEFDRVMRAHPEYDGSRSQLRIMIPDGGLISFVSERSPGLLRGHAVDAVLVTDPDMLTDDFVRLARPALHTALNPVLGVLL